MLQYFEYIKNHKLTDYPGLRPYVIGNACKFKADDKQPDESKQQKTLLEY